MEINEGVKIIVDRLKKEGFLIQKHYSMTSKSVYITLDFGVAHTIRISDHNGNRKFRYRYNIQKNVHRIHTSHGRKYYPLDNNAIERMIYHIKKERSAMIKKHGRQLYNHFMDKNGMENQGRRENFLRYRGHSRKAERR